MTIWCRVACRIREATRTQVQARARALSLSLTHTHTHTEIYNTHYSSTSTMVS
jgi:hypothetical protein